MRIEWVNAGVGPGNGQGDTDTVPQWLAWHVGVLGTELGPGFQAWLFYWSSLNERSEPPGSNHQHPLLC